MEIPKILLEVFMEINNSQLFKCLYNKVYKPSEYAPEKGYQKDVFTNVNLVSSAADNTKTYDVNSIGATLSDEALEKIYNKTLPELSSSPSQVQKMSTTYKDLSPENISKIKQAIFAIHNPDIKEPEVPDEPPAPEVKSFISTFGDTESMFEYLHDVNPAITKENGITKAQLVAISQNDTWEDANYDFFGSLNRIFDKLDIDDDAILSYSEIEAFIGKELGEDFSAYSSKVIDYSNQLQSEYELLSEQEKLEFALEKTREYLEASGMNNQINALDRLLGMDDLYNDIKVGQIAIADLNSDNNSEWITLGAYTSYNYPMVYEKDGKSYNISLFATDEDFTDEKGENIDLGITLDISLLDGNWYELVNVLVHELTHATAYQYVSEDGDGSITFNTIDTLYDKGLLTETEVEKFYNDTYSDEDVDRVIYLTSCLWGEYSAYQTDADYLDSIAGDVYDSGMTTAADGEDEKQVIIDQINAGYNEEGKPEEVYPDYKWWSFA